MGQVLLIYLINYDSLFSQSVFLEIYMSGFVYAVGFVEPDKSVLVYHKKNNINIDYNQKPRDWTPHDLSDWIKSTRDMMPEKKLSFIPLRRPAGPWIKHDGSKDLSLYDNIEIGISSNDHFANGDAFKNEMTVEQADEWFDDYKKWNSVEDTFFKVYRVFGGWEVYFELLEEDDEKLLMKRFETNDKKAIVIKEDN